MDILELQRFKRALDEAGFRMPEGVALSLDGKQFDALIHEPEALTPYVVTDRYKAAVEGRAKAFGFTLLRRSEPLTPPPR